MPTETKLLMLAISTIWPLLFLTMSGQNSWQVYLDVRQVDHFDSPVRGQVDVDQLLDLVGRHVEDGIVGSDTCVVDEDGGTAEFGSNLFSGIMNCFGILDVAFDV
jgi:hypothetical protein